MQSSVFISNKVHLLKRADGSALGFTHVFPHHRASYILGFPSIHTALHMSKCHVKPGDIKLSQHLTTNVLANATEAQREYWRRLRRDGNGIGAAPPPTPTLEVNFAAHLTFLKSDIAVPITDMCAIDTVPMEDFLGYPFTHNLGVALVRKVLSEDPWEIRTEAVIVEADTHTSDFLQGISE